MKLLKSISVYGFFALVEKSISFLIIPVLSRKLMPADYGILAMFNSVFALVFPFVILSTNGAIMVMFYKTDAKENTSRFSSYFSSALLTNLCLFLFVFLLFLVFSKKLHWLTGVETKWLLALPFIALLETCKSVLFSYLQIQKKALLYGLTSFAYTLINVFVTVVLLYQFDINYQSRLWGMLSSGSIILFLFVYFFGRKRLFTFNIRRDDIEDIVKYGLPLLPHTLGMLILDLADRFFINQFVGKSEVGIYNISYQLASVIFILSTVFTNAWVPHLYEELNKGNEKADKKIVQISYLFVLVLLAITLLYIAIIKYVYMYFIDPKYAGGLNYFNWLVLAYFFGGVYLIFAGIIFFEKRNNVFFKISLVNIVVNILLNYFLIRQFGALGAAYATCISMFVFASLIALFSHRTRPLPWLKFSLILNRSNLFQK